ncbi:MAG: SAM-dependent methyltransferase [Gammaproteobacteria bacterium]
MNAPPENIAAKSSARADVYGLFCRARNVVAETEIARTLGLHPNTVARWRERRFVPGRYSHDFLRLLGERQRAAVDARDRDQFYTKPDVARRCVRKMFAVAESLRINLSRHRFIEPAAGCGVFYEHLPPRRRIGMDIAPGVRPRGGLIRGDYLQWTPPAGKYVVVGNPPFGLRGHSALQFINHSAAFADIVAFILPQLFASDGKGAAQKRVREYRLAHTESLPADSFQYPDGRAVSVATVFQVWTKINTARIVAPPSPQCDNFIRVYSLSDGGTPASTRNKKMLHKCDVYLPSTCFTGMRSYPDFESLPHRRGYGVVTHSGAHRAKIKTLLQKHDWTKTAFRSTNGAMNLRRSLIAAVVAAAGYCDHV